MLKVLTILDALCKKNDYYYQVRNHFRLNNEIYNIFLTTNDRIVISSTPYEHLVEVWTSKHPTQDDGVRIPKDALLEYLLYIIKAEFND